VGSGTGRLGSPLGGGVVGAALVDTGAEVLLAAEFGEPLADGELACERPAAGVDLGLGAAPVADLMVAEPEPAIAPAAERAAEGDGRYSPRDAALSPPARPCGPVTGATCGVVVPGPAAATDWSVPEPGAGCSASRRGGAAVRLAAATAPPTAIGAATRPMRRGRPVRRWRGARRARLTGAPRTMTGIRVMSLESP
jgi:hypothetical protein